MLPIGMTSSLQQLFTLICLFYIGSIIAEPARETLGASLADARARGSYMGFSRLGLAFGGALGYAGGGWLFDAGKAVGQPELPWLMLGAIGVITFRRYGGNSVRNALPPVCWSRAPDARGGGFSCFQPILLARWVLTGHDALCQDEGRYELEEPHEKILIAAALIVSGLLSGCNQLTQYTVSEQEINQALQKRNHFAKDIGLKGVADAHIELQNLTSAIGREEPGKVTLSGIANVDLNSLFGTQKATIDLKLKALPTFDREKGAIFLQEMEVVDAKVAPEKLQSVIQALLPT